MIWNCGEISTNVPPYKKILDSDLKNIKGELQKLRMVRNIMNNIHRGSQQMGFGDMVKNMTQR